MSILRGILGCCATAACVDVGDDDGAARADAEDFDGCVWVWGCVALLQLTLVLLLVFMLNLALVVNLGLLCVLVCVFPSGRL